MWHERLLDYQGPAYAALYVQRLQRVLQAERAADPAGANGYAITREMVRWLALWMAFDDIVRVAAAKLAASRWQRVRREVGWRRRPAQGLRPLQARRARVRRAAAAGAGRSAAGLGPAPHRRRAWRPGRCR
jgi:hypothetical protein